MIKLVLLTGFLGAGKTTMMKKMLNAYRDAKTGVIVNEFGEINMDAKLLQQEGVQMAELSNGSIFCACIKDKFVDALIQMSCQDIDYLFIEASGLADPANIGPLLEGIQHKTLHSYDYRGSICIVDGESFTELYEVLPAITSQLEFCGAVIINKGDRIEEAQLKKTLELIQRINPQARSFVTSYCAVDVRDLVESLEQSKKAARESSNTAESRPTTFIVKGREAVPYEPLHEFLQKIAGDTYRIKGFARTERGNVEISAVGTNIELNPWEGPVEQTELVVISAIGFKMISILTKNLSGSLKGILRI